MILIVLSLVLGYLFASTGVLFEPHFFIYLFGAVGVLSLGLYVLEELYREMLKQKKSN